MTIYEKGTLGYYREKAKEHGFENISDYFKWKNKNIHLNPFSNKKVRKEYHLLRWRIKRILIEDNIIKNAYNWKTVLDKFDKLIIEILVNYKAFEKSEFIESIKDIRSSLIEHHTRYKEIHGYDETIWMTAGEHKDLHYHLRKNRKCNVSSEELKKISIAATGRTEKHKGAIKEYDKIEKRRKYKSDYCKEYIFRMRKNTTLSKNVRIYEEIIYNIKTGSLLTNSGFQYGRGKGFPTICID